MYRRGETLKSQARSRMGPVELLVAVAVVGLMAAMLVPVFAQERERARQAVCLANVRTIAQTLRMYLADHDSRPPPVEYNPEVLGYFNRYPGGGGKDQWDPARSLDCHRAKQANPYLRWPVILDSYLHTREVWRCPNSVLRDGACFINGGLEWLPHLQAHEGAWGWDTRPWMCPIPSWPAGWGGQVSDSLAQGRMAIPVGMRDHTVSPGTFLQSIGVNSLAGAEPSAVAIEDPAWYVVCADGGATIDDFCTGTLAYPDLCHLECAGPGDWEADWENCPWSKECGATGAMKINPELRKPYARHFGGVNIGFLDGHARWFHSEEVIAESPSEGNPRRGRLRGYGPWGPTKDSPWYDPDDGIPPLY